MRQRAEASLKRAERTAGYASALLKISGDGSLKYRYKIDVTLAAAIQFGALVEKHWKYTDEQEA